MGFDLTPGFSLTDIIKSVTPNFGTGGTTNQVVTRPSTTADPWQSTQTTQTPKSDSGTVNTPDNASIGMYGAYTGSGSGSGSGVSLADLAQYDQAVGQYEAQLARLPGQLQIATGNIGKQYGIAKNELNTALTNAQKGYDTSTGQNSQQYVTNKNAIRDNFSAGLRGLMRMLGAYGAGGSDVRLVSDGVAQDAQRQASGAGQTYAENQQGLDMNWGNYQNDWRNSDKKLSDWQTEEIRKATATSDTSKQSILQAIAQLKAQRASAAGGNPAAAAQPYLDQASALQGTIDQLGIINPTYDGTTPTYTSPTLSSYVTPQQQASGITPNSTTTSNTPYLYTLLPEKKKTVYGF